ncbi:MAG: HD domain-containing protein [Brevefilum sp.]|nr:HD domain-containing protein [Brevefilum sp.]MDW7755082.1 HD domain-containing protein [Brevefilum sp.]
MEKLTIEEARGWYQDADPVHDFDHVLRVYRVATRIANAEGADLEIVQAAALLHDSQGSAPGEPGNARAEHHIASAEFANEVLRSKGWPEEKIKAVQHCIRSHRFRGKEDAPETLEAKVLFDADKLDVLGAIGAARTVAYAALDDQPVYAEPSQQFLTTGNKEPGEPHSSYHEFLFKLRNVKDRMFTKTGKNLAEARHAYLVEFFTQLTAEVRGER